jgi:hypothetical protein
MANCASSSPYSCEAILSISRQSLSAASPASTSAAAALPSVVATTGRTASRLERPAGRSVRADPAPAAGGLCVGEPTQRTRGLSTDGGEWTRFCSSAKCDIE